MSNTEILGKFDKMPLGRIKPEGWLRRQLCLQASGLTGRLDEIWNDVSNNSAWLGGNGEAWERGPYYLDGLVSLAYLLDDAFLIEKCNRWIERIIMSADESGNFGPKRTGDWWPRVVALKALASYGEATGDKQIAAFMRGFFKYQFNKIDEQPPAYWASARAFEEIIPLNYFVKNGGDEKLCGELIAKLKTYSYDWFKIFEKFKYKKTAKHYLCRGAINFGRKVGAKKAAERCRGTVPLKTVKAKTVIRRNKLPIAKKLQTMHGVNNAMAVKYPVLYAEYFADDKLKPLSKRAIDELLKYHGTAVGVFTSDELLDGTNPSKGIELCAVVEFMYSLENLLAATGDVFYADLLELVAYNALPATINKNFTAHQYLQQVNQISATVAKRGFFDVDDDANIFGLEPNFGCCTANMHQGFPKLCENLCYERAGELAFLIYAPCAISAISEAGTINLTEMTDYPFKNHVKITVTETTVETETTLHFRVPKYASAVLKLNGLDVEKAADGVISVRKQLVRGDCFELVFDTPLVSVMNPDRSTSFRRGSLLMATQLNAKRKVLSGNEPFSDSAYIATTQWRTAPVVTKKGLSVKKIEESEVAPMPFDESMPPIKVMYDARYVTNWDEVKNSADAVPSKPKFTEHTFVRTLVPYGCTRLRIAQHPVCAKHKKRKK